jgi:hypothetical protein
MPEHYKWFIVEIITFYALILSAIIYLFLASIFKVKRKDLLIIEAYE